MALFDSYKPTYLGFDYVARIDDFMDDLSVRWQDLEDASYEVTIGGTITDIISRVGVLEGDYAEASEGFANLDARLTNIESDVISALDGTGIYENAITESSLLVSNSPTDGYVLSYDEISGMTWIPVSSIGGVSGPETSVDTSIAIFDSEDGTTIDSTGVLIDSNNCLYNHCVKTSSTPSSRLLATTDAGTIVILTGTGAKTVSLPDAATMQIGFHCVVLNRGSGAVTFAKVDSGDTLEAKGTSMDGQYSAATVIRIDTSTWAIYGDII